MSELSPQGGNERYEVCDDAPPLLHTQTKEVKKGMSKERFEQRLFRIFAQAGYSPIRILTVTPEEMVEIPGVTVPEIRAVLCIQNKVLAEQNNIRQGRLVAELIKAAQESEADHE